MAETSQHDERLGARPPNNTVTPAECRPQSELMRQRSRLYMFADFPPPHPRVCVCVMESFSSNTSETDRHRSVSGISKGCRPFSLSLSISLSLLQHWSSPARPLHTLSLSLSNSLSRIYSLRLNPWRMDYVPLFYDHLWKSMTSLFHGNLALKKNIFALLFWE